MSRKCAHFLKKSPEQGWRKRRRSRFPSQPSACHPEPASPKAKQMKFPQWLNAIDLLRKLPKTSGERVILSAVELLRSEMSEAKARGVSRCGISQRVLPAYRRWVTFLCADKKQMNVEKIAVIFRRSLPLGAGFARSIRPRRLSTRKTSTPARNALRFSPPLRMTPLGICSVNRAKKDRTTRLCPMYAEQLLAFS